MRCEDIGSFSHTTHSSTERETSSLCWTLAARALHDLSARQVVGFVLDVTHDGRDPVRPVRVVYVRVQRREVRGRDRADGLEVAAVVGLQRGGQIHIPRHLGVALQVDSEMLHEAPLDRLPARVRAVGRHRERGRGEIRALESRSLFRGTERRRNGHPGELCFTHGNLAGRGCRRLRQWHARCGSTDDTSTRGAQRTCRALGFDLGTHESSVFSTSVSHASWIARDQCRAVPKVGTEWNDFPVSENA